MINTFNMWKRYIILMVRTKNISPPVGTPHKMGWRRRGRTTTHTPLPTPSGVPLRTPNTKGEPPHPPPPPILIQTITFLMHKAH